MNNKYLQLLYPKETYDKIVNSNILMIGVGGIGCELLKVLTKAGFRRMTILDLDKIEMTNLNRQFYFRRTHVGMSKAEVGKVSVSRKIENLEINAIHGSIFEDRFDVEFYSQFDMVFCALDNAAAREHLGRMCIKSAKIMIDAGTGGFNGQANVIKRFFSQCNNCNPAPQAKSFAICTIRASPSEPIHCITFGMALYDLFFGPLDDSNYLANLLNLQQLWAQRSQGLERMKEIGVEVFDQIFFQQIAQGLKEYTEKQENLSINQYKYPLKYEDAIKDQNVYATQDQNNIQDKRERLKPFSEYAKDFVEYFAKISLFPEFGTLKFDKDDWDAVKFVTAVTNIRTYNFTRKFKNVDQQKQDSDKLKYLSEAQVRKDGGKIIPAIASTNSIAASLQCVDAFKVAAEKFNLLRLGWISTARDKIGPTFLQEPYDSCLNCSKKNVYIHAYADFDTTQFKFVVEIARIFGVSHLDMYSQNTGGTIYGEKNRQLEKYNQKTLVKTLKDVNNDENPYISQTYCISQQELLRKFFWDTCLRFEIIIIHRKIEKPQISEATKLEDIFEQIRQLKFQKYQELIQDRKSQNQQYGYAF